MLCKRIVCMWNMSCCLNMAFAQPDFYLILVRRNIKISGDKNLSSHYQRKMTGIGSIASFAFSRDEAMFRRYSASARQINHDYDALERIDFSIINVVFMI